MRKLIAFLIVGLSLNAYADTKISAFPSTTTLNASDIIPVVTNPGSSPGNYSITKANLISTLGIGAISTNTILNQSTLQSGSTFYVSSGTVQGPLTINDQSAGSIISLFSQASGGTAAAQDFAIYGLSSGAGSLNQAGSFSAVGAATTNNGIIVSATGGTNNHAINISNGDIFTNSAAGTSGQVLTSAGAGNVPTWATVSGGGGSSSLQVTQSGVQITSPTVSMNFNGNDFILSAISSTSTIRLNPSTTNYIQNTSTLQSGATFYVSSGTIKNFYIPGNFVANATTVTYQGQGFALMNADSVGPSFVANNGYMDVSSYVNAGTIYKIGGQTIINHSSGDSYGINNAGQIASQQICAGSNSCTNATSGATGNSVFGANSLVSNTSGKNNVCLGDFSCNQLTTDQNVCIGYNSCFSQTTGSENVAIGYLAGQNMTIGSNNAIFGWSAGRGITTGVYNTIIGDNASATDLTTGYSNVVIGNDAGQNTATGSSNTYINAAGATYSSNGANSGDILIGFGSSEANTTSPLFNSVAIGYNSIASSSNTMQIGGTLNNALNVIGSTFTFSSGTVNSAFNLNGTLKLSNSAGTNGQVLTSGGAGTVPTWTTISGGGSGASSLQITQSGIQITSPTVSMNFNGNDFILSAISSTSTIRLNPSTTNYIQNTSTLQSGSTFYVSSGTAQNFNASTVTVSNAIQMNGSGNLSFVNKPDGLTYQVLGSSITSCTTGQTWVVGSSNTAVCVTSSGPTITFEVKGSTAISTLGTISSAACSSAVTVSASGVATTDIVNASFNGDPTGITGFAPLTTGMLTIIPYPSSNNVNFKVCNNTSSSITPGTFTLNYQVIR